MTGKTTTTARGFTFIEVLVALAVASIAMLGLLGLHLTSLRTADAAQARTEAVFLAQAKLAEASASDYPRQGADAGTVERNGLRLSWQTEVSDAGPPAAGGLALRGLRRVRSTVTWQQGADRKSMQMETYLADSRLDEHKPQ